jgi:hypothetical protein
MFTLDPTWPAFHQGLLDPVIAPVLGVDVNPLSNPIPWLLAAGNVGSVLLTRRGRTAGWPVLAATQLLFLVYATLNNAAGFYVQNVVMTYFAVATTVLWTRHSDPLGPDFSPRTARERALHTSLTAARTALAQLRSTESNLLEVIAQGEATRRLLLDRLEAYEPSPTRLHDDLTDEPLVSPAFPGPPPPGCASPAPSP